MENNKLLTIKDICSIDEVGQVVWLECYFDGHISLQPYMHDIDPTQKPIMINAWGSFYNLEECDVREHIANSFNIYWNDKRYRWWNNKPNNEIRKNCNKWEYIK